MTSEKYETEWCGERDRERAERERQRQTDRERKRETERQTERDRETEREMTLENLYFVCQLSVQLSSALLSPSNSVGPIKTGNNLTRSPCDSQSTAGLTDCPASYYQPVSGEDFLNYPPWDDGNVAAVSN